MNDNAKTKTQLITELAAMRERVAELEALESDRKQMEAALQENEERYRRLVEQSPNGIVIYGEVDGEERIVFINPAGAKIFGAEKPEELIGKPSFDFVHPDSRALVEVRSQKILEQAWQAPKVEEKLVRLDGTVIDVEVIGISTTYQGMPAIQAVIRDITESKQAEEALRETEAKYRTLVEQLPAITYTVEFFKEGSRTTYISPQVETLLGFSQAEWVADRNLWVKQIHPADRDKVLAEVTRGNAIGEPLNLEYRILARDGRVFWFRNRQTILIQDETGRPRYIHGVMFDITEQKKLEEQLLQAQKMEAVGQMAGGIAHNFNNVLTALIGHTELAIMQLSAEHPVYDNLETIRKSAQRAAKLTHQLLAFTRHQVTHQTVINLNDLVLNIDSTLQQLVHEPIDLVMSLEPEVGRVKVDAAQMEQALVNLVVNARDAMPNGGKLTIESANITFDSAYVSQHTGVHPGEYVMLAISDTGTGMTSEIKEHIFEPFFTTKDVDAGTGLGLSACYGIVKQNSGYIMVYSEPSHGTTFKVYLPRFLEKTSETELVRNKPDSLPARNQTILLVEDEFVVRELAVRVLSQQGYTVLEATNGEDALSIIQAQSGRELHLLITDISMPGLSGDVLAKQLLAMYPNLKVLFMSGYTDKAIVHRGIIDADVEILSKPFTPDALTDKVYTILSEEDE